MTELQGEHVVLRPPAPGDAPRLLEIHRTPEVMAWWGAPDAGFPDDEPSTTRYVVLEDGGVVGMVQFGEEREPDFRHAWIDIFLEPAVHGRGLGADAVRTLAGHVVAAHGHHRITIDPAVDNVPAIRCYLKAGFSPVGTERRAWRDPQGRWRDQLLMERVEPAGPHEPEPAAGSFDAQAFLAAFAARDAERLLAFYAPDAEWIEYRHDAPPRAPHVLRGRDQIGASVRAVAAADLELSLRHEVVGAGRLAFMVTVVVGEGRQIVEHVIVEHRDGHVVRQVGVEARD